MSDTKKKPDDIDKSNKINDLENENEYVNNVFPKNEDKEDKLPVDKHGEAVIQRGPLRTLPLVPLRGLTIFPYMTMPFDAAREKSIKAIEAAMADTQEVILVTQNNSTVSDPQKKDIYKVGILAHIRQLIRVPGDAVRVLVNGIERVEILDFERTEPYIKAQFRECYMEAVVRNDNGMGVPRENADVEALFRTVIGLFEEYSVASGRIGQETITAIVGLDSYSDAADMICSHLPMGVSAKQEILEEFDEEMRLFKLMEMLKTEIEIAFIEKDIHDEVKANIDKSQREYFLREQLKVIRKELGESETGESEVDELRKQLEELRAPDYVKEKVKKELKRMSKLQPGAPEMSVLRNYVECILGLPWDTKSESVIDIQKATEILDRDHYGLEEVKERVLEFLAVMKLRSDLKGQIICLVGPPGVGKTSIARAVAEAVGRKYVRISLGGVSDEAELRGHRKTYIGAMPGRIINALTEAKTSNPLILFDEIDKMNSDYKGDPASAMLEVLDGEQNKTFVDHYVEIPYDLSDVMFMTTANSIDSIPRPLLDRMEIIEVSGYTYEEKLEIGIRHLVPKQLEAHGIDKKMLKINRAAMRDIINKYTHEAGVRNLERTIAKVCRKAAKELIAGVQTVSVSSKSIPTMLGAPKYAFIMANKKDEVGVARGLAWTSVGGDTLEIEVNVVDGNGKIELTGQLGDVMKESARVAVSYVRANAKKLGIDSDFYEKKDIHVHAPDGATPKEGPSAGVTLTTSIVSALRGVPVRCDVAMTGEVTIRGNVLPVGGIKEKVIAAHRAGIKTIILPKANASDIEKIPENVAKDLKFITVDKVNEVLEFALR